jgi:glycosyltransferase involved in cell wall biosynthesis
MRDFFNKRHIQDYAQLVFVGEPGFKSFKKVFPELSDKLVLCNNPINRNVFKLSEEKIELKHQNVPVFINVARHDEHQKKIERLLDASAKLKASGHKFKLILVGDGPDHQYYKDKVTRLKLTNEIIFTGIKANPYPYFKISDAFVLTSDYEGYPGVLTEAFMLGLDVISTFPFKVQTLPNKIISADKNADNIYLKMAEYIKNKHSSKSPKPIIEDLDFYNQTILEKIESVINYK